MKHKHYDLLIAFANGAEIQYRMIDKEMEWLTDANPWWNCERMEFRIKPEPKSDFIAFVRVYPFIKDTAHTTNAYFKKETYDNLMVTFDGETNELKDAKVIK